ncbi:MAG: ATP-binding protein [Leptolyngbya sp. BL-A-14]
MNVMDWHQANQQSLLMHIDRLRQRLQQYIHKADNPEARDPLKHLDSLVKPITPATPDFALDHLRQTFGLSVFEQDVLLLCAGLELEADFAQLCAIAQREPQRPYATFSLAMTLSAYPDWQALSPDSSLRRWKMIELGAGNALTTSPIRIDEQILHYLLGKRYLNDRLTGFASPLPSPDQLVASHQQLAEQAIQTWVAVSQAEGVLPILQLCGSDLANQRAIAATVCLNLNLTAYSVSAELLPTDLTNLTLVKCLWEREYLLNRTTFVLEWLDTGVRDPKQESAIAHLLETLDAPVMLLSRDRQRQNARAFITFEVKAPTAEEQQHLWQQALGEAATGFEAQMAHLISYFNLSAPTIRTLATKVQQSEVSELPLPMVLWNLCRTQARPRLDELADHIESSAGWDDLVLPDRELEVLQRMALQLRQRLKVYQEWGFGGKSQRGLGISALFAGGSGTGKTMAAEVLANELHLDLYRIDLSAVVSKYIGETEKNLGRVFDAAETGGVILLFDEADSLFGKRSEVKDSHDRHANMEVSYLLQRMESYRGLSVLTTNLKGSIDQAFLRRIRFILNFPFPDQTQRAEIWRRVFPKQTPTAGLDEWKLAKLSIAGGNIRSIALNAAFLAAEADEPLQMKHILIAAQNEYIKMEKPLTDVEVRGWV